MIPYGIPTYVLTDNGLQLVGKLFTEICGYPGVKDYKKTAYNPQTNYQTEWYNETIAVRMRKYLAENQAGWEAYVKLLTYAYNTQVNSLTNVTKFRIVLSRQQTGPATMEYPTTL